jgi:hypothetical protein
MKIQNHTHPMRKLCHSSIGDVIYLSEEDVYCVVAADLNVRVQPQHEGGTGLFACPYLVFLINLHNGFRLHMPNLSSLVGTCKDARLLISECGETS